MQTRTLLWPAFFLSVCLAAGTTFAQPASTPADANTVKKELVAKLLKLQQPGIEALARNLTEQPAAQLLDQASLFLQARVPADKREAVTQEIGKDVQAYTKDAMPLVRDRAIKLAPTTVGKVLQEHLQVDELKQVVAMLESPAYAKYMQLSGDMQRALIEKLVAETRATIDPKLNRLESSISRRLNAAAGQPPTSAPGK